MHMCLTFAGSEIKGDKSHISAGSYNWQSREVGHVYANRAVGIKLACLLLCFSAQTTHKKPEKRRSEGWGQEGEGETKNTAVQMIKNKGHERLPCFDRDIIEQKGCYRFTFTFSQLADTYK